MVVLERHLKAWTPCENFPYLDFLFKMDCNKQFDNIAILLFFINLQKIDNMKKKRKEEIT